MDSLEAGRSGRIVGTKTGVKTALRPASKIAKKGCCGPYFFSSASLRFCSHFLMTALCMAFRSIRKVSLSFLIVSFSSSGRSAKFLPSGISAKFLPSLGLSAQNFVRWTSHSALECG